MNKEQEERLIEVLEQLSENIGAVKEGLEYHKHDVDGDVCGGSNAVKTKEDYEDTYEIIDDIDKIFKSGETDKDEVKK